MNSDLTEKALRAATSCLWPEAVDLNLAILKEDKTDTEALNRLAHAYKELGQINLAQTTYRKVLKLDHFNPIAMKNLKFLEALPKNFKKTDAGQSPKTQNETFLEEPGKTRIANLINLAPLSVLLNLSCGTRADLIIKRHSVNVVGQNGVYLGALPDDLSAKLMKFLSGGNRYEVFIKTVARKTLTVFIRELSRANRFKNQPSFPITTGKHLYHEDELKIQSELEEKDNEEEAGNDEEV